MKNYNDGFSKQKENERQSKCYMCENWDVYVYKVLHKKTKEKIVVCFQCYHEGINKEFEDI